MFLSGNHLTFAMTSLEEINKNSYTIPNSFQVQWIMAATI